MIGAYREYKNGFLPVPGGWLDQTMIFGDAMQTIDSAMSKIDEKESDGNR